MLLCNYISPVACPGIRNGKGPKGYLCSRTITANKSSKLHLSCSDNLIFKTGSKKMFFFFILNESNIFLKKPRMKFTPAYFMIKLLKVKTMYPKHFVKIRSIMYLPCASTVFFIYVAFLKTNKFFITKCVKILSTIFLIILPHRFCSVQDHRAL